MSDNHDDDRDENVDNDDQIPADDETDYDVGYRKPPRAGQFKPGQSGNPKGRKKGSRGLKTDLRAELLSKVPVTENGKTKQLTKQQLVLKALVTKAAKGDTKAAAQVLSMTMQMFGIEDERVGKSQISAADEALLADYVAGNSRSSEPPHDWPAETAARTATNEPLEELREMSEDHGADPDDADDLGQEYDDNK